MYIQQNFAGAVQLYDSLLKMNYRSPDLEFNIANSYYRTGDIARAILHYERAKLLNPSDSDVHHNLKIAYLSTIDKIEPLPKVFYQIWWENFVFAGSVDNRAKLTLVLLWISFIFFGGYILLRKTSLRKISFYGFLIFLLTGVSSLGLLWRQNQYLNNNRGAIIFAESTYVKSSPDENGANLFRLHAGTKVEIRGEISGWKKIRIANGNEGWIASGHLETI
jgi:hypothetical protein